MSPVERGCGRFRRRRKRPQPRSTACEAPQVPAKPKEFVKMRGPEQLHYLKIRGLFSPAL